MVRHRSYDPPQDEPDADVFTQDAEPTEPAEEAVVTPMTVAQVDTHKQNVTAAAGSKQSTIAAALTTYRGGGTLATLISAVKAADIAYYQAFISSAQTNVQPTGGALEALRQLGG
jgi:hypothetical protein